MTDKGADTDGKYYVKCPNCGKQSGPYTAHMTRGGRMCSCGVNFRIDVENQEAGEVLNAPAEDSDI